MWKIFYVIKKFDLENKIMQISFFKRELERKCQESKLHGDGLAPIGELEKIRSDLLKAESEYEQLLTSRKSYIDRRRSERLEYWNNKLKHEQKELHDMDSALSTHILPKTVALKINSKIPSIKKKIMKIEKRRNKYL